MERLGGRIAVYCVHVVVAAYICPFLVFVSEIILAAVLGISDLRLQKFVIGPTFIAPILSGIIAGYYVGRYLRSGAMRCLFGIPLAIGAWEILTWYRYSLHNGAFWAVIRENFLGSQCGASECLEEALITLPLISSLAYMLGAEIYNLKLIRRKHRVA